MLQLTKVVSINIIHSKNEKEFTLTIELAISLLIKQIASANVDDLYISLLIHDLEHCTLP